MLDAYAEYLAHRRFSANTIRLRVGYVRRFESFHIDRTASFVLAEIVLSDIELFLRSNPKWQASTVQTIVASMRSFFRWAVRVELVEKNPAEDIDAVRVPHRSARIASDQAIRDALKRACLEDAAMLLLGAECGLRVSEIASLRKSDRNGNWLTVLGKGNNQRSVYLSPELARVLDRIEARRSRDFYFPSTSGGHIASSTVWRHVREMINMNTHSLRHRAGTTVYREAGHDLRLAQVFLGHSNPTITALYVHIEDNDLRRASAVSRMAA